MAVGRGTPLGFASLRAWFASAWPGKLRWRPPRGATRQDPGGELRWEGRKRPARAGVRGRPLVGTKLGNYLILEKVGEGGAGEVFKARDLLLGRIVAIKAVREDFAFQPQVLERFRTEARTLAKLNHPQIATLHSLHEEDGRQLMVMEYVDGRTLAHLVRATGALPLEHALSLFYQALDGIGYAHEHGIVHRDLKSSNLMVTALGVVKIMDFGIARALGSGRVTRHGHMVGTLQYVAPEQVQGLESDMRSDVYSLGVVLFQLLTGRLPFEGATDYELMRAQVETPPPRPSAIVPGIPEAVEAALLRGLAKRPEDRWPTAAAFAAALAAASGIPAGVRPLPLPDLVPARGGDAPTPITGLAATAAIGRDDLPTRERTTLERRAAKVVAEPSRPPRRWERLGAALALLALALGVDLLVSAPETPGRPVRGAASSPPTTAPAARPILLADPGVEPWPEPLEPDGRAAPTTAAAGVPTAGPSPDRPLRRRAPPALASTPRPALAPARAPRRPAAAAREGDPGWVIRR